MAKEFCPHCGKETGFWSSTKCSKCGEYFCDKCVIKSKAYSWDGKDESFCYLCFKAKFENKIQKIENGFICKGCGKNMDIAFVVCPYCKTNLKEEKKKKTPSISNKKKGG